MNVYNTNNGNTNTFVIALDAIDLNYLPTSINRFDQDKVTPIWTKGNLDLRNNEYYEFEVMNKEDSQSISEDEIIDYTICHICDINVPKPYLTEHNMSVKHKTHKKVIEIALNRTKNNINHVEVIHNMKQNQEVYFCTSCVAIIKLIDKREHETSVNHKNSLLVDKLLQDFLILFSNNESHCSDSNGNESCNDLVVRDKNNEKDDEVQKPYDDNELQTNTSESSLAANKINVDSFVQKLINDNSTNETFDHMSDNNSLQTPININGKMRKSDVNKGTGCVFKKNEVKTNVQNDEVNYSNVEDMKRFIECMNKICCDKIDITVLDDMNLEVITLEGSCVKVPADNFLGLKKFSKKHLQCLLCREIVRISLKEQHIFDNAHIKKVSTHFKNKDCVRIIDHSLCHCVICNMIIENSDLHVLCNEEHTRLLKGSLVSDVEEVYKPIPPVSSLKHPKEVFSIKQSIVTESVESKDILWSDKVKGNGTEESVKTNKVINKSDHFKEIEPDELAGAKNEVKYCIICEIDVQSENLQIHHNSIRHKINTNIKNLEVHYLMEIVNQEELKCLICVCPVKKDSAAVQQHLLSQKHVELYNKLLLDNNLKGLKNYRFFCTLCKVQVFKINELSHINGEEHKQKMELTVVPNTLMPNSVDTIKDDDKKPVAVNYLCVVCNLQVPNTETCIFIHNSGARHVKNVSQMKASLGEISKNNIGSTENIQSSLFDIHYHMTLTNLSNSLYCIVCDVTVPLHEKNMLEHIEGINHRSSYQCLLENSHLILANDKISCKICSINIDDKQELIHSKTKKHVKNLELYKKSLSTDENKTLMPTQIKTDKVAEPTNLTNNVTTDLDTKTPNNNLSKTQIKNAHTSISLKPSVIVDINKPTTSSNNLINSNKAVKYYLLRPTATPNALECVICNVKVPNNESNIVTYLRGRNHNMKYEALLKENSLVEKDDKFYCGLCEVIFIIGTEIGHINDPQHKLNTWQTLKSKSNSVFENVKIENIFKCSICNVKLSNSDANITEHNSGSQHVQMTKLFTENKLTFKDGAVYCEICEIGFPQCDISDHLETVKHVIEKYF